MFVRDVCMTGVFIGLLAFCPARLLQSNVCLLFNPNIKGQVANFFSRATFCIVEVMRVFTNNQ